MSRTALWEKVKAEMSKKAEFGQFTAQGVTTGAHFITLIDATDIATRLIVEDRLK